MSIEMDEPQRRSYLKDEYLLLQNQYEDYDKRSLTIKGWMSAGAAAALGVASNSSSKLALFTPVIVAVIVMSTWVLEAYWKVFQYALADRIRMIEAHFRNDQEILIKDPDPFQIYHWWYRSYAYDKPIFLYEEKERKRPKPLYERLWRAALHWYVCLPYFPIVILCCFSILVIWLQPDHFATSGSK
jgi:hypothetical protein